MPRFLAIPQKKSPRNVLRILTRAEIDALLAATDPDTYSGQRDRLRFTILYNTGTRISEAEQEFAMHRCFPALDSMQVAPVGP